MKYLRNKSTNPYFNLALDEYAMNLDIKEPFFYIWRNAPAVIIGKYQNALAEVNHQFLRENNIKLCRRISGGGAVYHDLGNVNYTFIIPSEKVNKADLRSYSQIMLKALNSLGLNAELSGRNDLSLNGKKFSGTAQRFAHNKLMYHGTLMFDLNLENLVKALNVDSEKYTSKGFKSLRSRVVNIKDHLAKDLSVEEFMQALIYYLSNEGQDKEIKLSKEDIKKIKALETNKFSTWEWIYGKSPEFNFRNKQRFPSGEIEVLIQVETGLIKDIKFYGDFLGFKDVSIVEEKLKGKKYALDTIKNELDKLALTEYFGKITSEELSKLIFE